MPVSPAPKMWLPTDNPATAARKPMPPALVEARILRLRGPTMNPHLRQRRGLTMSWRLRRSRGLLAVRCRRRRRQASTRRSGGDSRARPQHWLPAVPWLSPRLSWARSGLSGRSSMTATVDEVRSTRPTGRRTMTRASGTATSTTSVRARVSGASASSEGTRVGKAGVEAPLMASSTTATIGPTARSQVRSHTRSQPAPEANTRLSAAGLCCVSAEVRTLRRS